MTVKIQNRSHKTIYDETKTSEVNKDQNGHNYIGKIEPKRPSEYGSN